MTSMIPKMHQYSISSKHVNTKVVH